MPETPDLERRTLRHSLALLHTWVGVVLGAVLFVVFWMGSLSVFDREIDRWMMPETRLGPPPPVSLDRIAESAAALAAGAPQWSVSLPDPRVPTVQLRYPGPEGSVVRHLDPASGRALEPQGTLGGSGFIFPFHFRLHLDWLDLGIWLVGLCGMAMLVLVVSGVVIHRRIFRDFFMFRPGKALSRSSLDLHTAMGVLALPFHFVMPLSGLIIFFSVFFPGTWHATFDGDRSAFNRETFGNYQRPKLGKPGASLGSLDAMAAEATRHWQGAPPSFVRVFNAGDAASYVEIRRSARGEVERKRDVSYFDAQTGAELARFQSKPVAAVQSFIAGIHFVQFDNWLLRWLYFAGGLSGCVMILTGFLFWLASRRAAHAREGRSGVRWVEALATGSVTGTVLGTLAFFAANRCLPEGASLGRFGRADLEVVVFYAVWLLSFGHAAWRVRAAWGEQCAAIAGLAAVVPLSNWISTGDHPLRALQRSAAVAGMDLLLFVLAAVAFVAARRLWRERPAPALSPAGALSQAAESEVAHG